MSRLLPFFNPKSFSRLVMMGMMGSMLLTACSVLSAPVEQSSQGEESRLATQEQALESDDEVSEADSSDSGADVPPVWAHCPADPIEVTMFVHHTWNFSPNRETEKMSVDGRTGELASCAMTIHGSQVEMADCIIPITNTGFMKSDDGMCDITASGFALISLEEGVCQDGVIVLTLTETMDPGAGYDGAMNCPDISQPYIPFYPPSLTTREYAIQVGGMSATESMNPDLSNQFRYTKEWTLISDAFPFPEENE